MIVRTGHRQRRRLTTLCILALALTACGGDDEEGGSGTPPPSSPPSGSAQDNPPANQDPGNLAISGQPHGKAMVGESYTFQPTVSSDDNGGLSFAVVSLPSWASFDNATGRISGTPEPSHIATYEGITISVSNGTDTATLGPFAVQVVDVAFGSVTLSWEAPDQNEDGTVLNDLSGYRIYYGQESGAYDQSVTVNSAGQTQYVVDGLLPRTYYFAVTALTASGLESDYSNEAVTTVDET